MRTTPALKLASLSQDDLELREKTDDLRSTLESLNKEEVKLCACWCQVVKCVFKNYGEFNL